MGPGTLFSLLFSQLLFLASGDPIEAGEKNPTAAEPEDMHHQNKGCLKMWKRDGFYCYRYFDTPKSFSEAEDECQSNGWDTLLTSISSGDVSVFLADLVKDAENDVWIGLSNVDNCNNWTWVDETQYNANDALWAHGQPSHCDGHHSCVQLIRSKQFQQWKDADCSTRTGYICEAPLKQ